MTLPSLDDPAIEKALQDIAWNADGLLPTIAQDDETGQILMMAWMNKASLAATLQSKEAVYWSRSRQKLWHKGETSGHVQTVTSVQLDCDADTLLLKVKQHGGIACHTGRAHCFFKDLNQQGEWEAVEPVLKDPSTIYG